MATRDLSGAKSPRQRPRAAQSAVSAITPTAGAMCVVGVGASAGGLDACKRLLGSLPEFPGMAFVLVQHLDPTHHSMLSELLATATKMHVQEAIDGVAVLANHVYVIPPGKYLSLVQGVLRLSVPAARHGARMPFDFLLQALAASAGPRAVCVILSGSGADGAVGAQAIKSAGGVVIAQDPEEAGYDGMPRNAIATGAVDFVLPVDKISKKLVDHQRQLESPTSNSGLSRIVALLRAQTPHDFTLYKPGTLDRRIARRMGIAGIAANDHDRYLAMLGTDTKERDLLAADLLINVTSFFRDPKIFENLAATIIPELVRNGGLDKPIRIWVAGCSTGEETYSLAMLFQEQVATAGKSVKLQVFASDVDAQAVATAREGLYPLTIATHVSAARLQRFFTKEENGYRISSDLRGCVVFAVQDVLSDPPFSKLDLISCRNLLIYLRPEAQARIISIFDFALHKDAFLLLGSAETVSGNDGRFSLVSKPARLYRKIKQNRPGDAQFSAPEVGLTRNMVRPLSPRLSTRLVDKAEVCRRLVLECYAPAAILIDQRLECLYSTGPTALYLRVAPGYPTNNLLELMGPALRARAKAAINKSIADNARVIVSGGRILRDGIGTAFNIDVRPVPNSDEREFLVCFIDELKPDPKSTSISKPNVTHDSELERELEETRAELRHAVRSLELSSEERNIINEEALSVNEEYQSTNEELLTSKEELQSLNEELTALNIQLQETLDRSRTTSSDLQNVLYSTDVATLFLDVKLNIRFFTPATRSLFAIIPTDIGRSLADFQSLAADTTLAEDARSVLRNSSPIEREIVTGEDVWFLRRVQPYKAHDQSVEGVVITFTDITERKAAKSALVEARLDAERANLTKSRFLAAASHDLRQPLQSLVLLNGLLTKVVDAPTVDRRAAHKLVRRVDDTMGTMTGILNTLLDINQIDAGIVRANPVSFPINDLMLRIYDEFEYIGEARGLSLRMIPSSLTVYTDPALLEQMIRNLVSNALKYTNAGRVLFGCRRHGSTLSVEVWDTGKGIPDHELAAIFNEYHQLDNAARERSRGLGLGLAIVKRLGDLLENPVGVRSVIGKGSVFTITIPLRPMAGTAAARDEVEKPVLNGLAVQARHAGSIMIVEDDQTIRELLEIYLREEGYQTAIAADGAAALAVVSAGKFRPDLILADYNLPDAMNGLQVTSKLRAILKRQAPVIILTGDISTETLREISLEDCAQLNKPMKLADLTALIEKMMPEIQAERATDTAVSGPTIFIVDDDAEVRDMMRAVLEDDGQKVQSFASCEAFLIAYEPGRAGCLLVDGYLPGMDGLELLQKLGLNGNKIPSIMITGHGDLKMAVNAMKAGASDFLEKPVNRPQLLAAIDRALEQSSDTAKLLINRENAIAQIALLTNRQRQIMERILEGEPNKSIAADLGISQRTVENHRASIMVKTGTKSLPALARMAMTALGGEARK
jgi:two-component system, chemotaxis family, CheB/CheR fusion protein